jgi:hypothetical protein
VIVGRFSVAVLAKFQGDCCATCKFFDTTKQTPPLGMCRRYPPFVPDFKYSAAWQVFPMVKESDWCGEFHGVDETK